MTDPPDEQQPVTVFGIRHHGPGSARSLVVALQELRPDLILVEGPPEADDLLSLATSPDLRPPVALLAYATKRPGRAAFWPFATFSPEWQAIRYSTDHGVPLRFCDLPAAYRFGTDESRRDSNHPVDPIGLLAEAAGYDDAERWWDDVIEHRRDGVPPFAAIAEAMTAVRDGTEDAESPTVDSDVVREAYMRTTIRAALKQGHTRIAVVCGAWHVPALTGRFPPASRDAAILRGRPKTPVAVTWVPWTHGRLASWQGYGAGVSSPGWYHHLFTAPDHVVERWLVEVAGVLRAEDLPISSAHVIEAVRLADALGALRGRPVPGLSEVTEATRAVICEGDELRLSLVRRRLVVGERLGAVPEETPSVPIARDLAAQQKRLRLPAEALERDIDLDLRKDNDLARSRLLHRLRLLDVDWGTPADEEGGRRGKGTFWESWRLAWTPEFAVDLISASAYGTTVEAAATAKVAELAADAADLAAVTDLVERCLLADLGTALRPVLAALDERVALDLDVVHLMRSLPALARSLRYGDVRGTDLSALDGVVGGMVLRIRVGLPAEIGGLDDDATKAMRATLDSTHAAIALLADRLPVKDQWLDALAGIAGVDGSAGVHDLPGLLEGRLTRLLRDADRLGNEEVGRRMALSVSVGVPPARAASWVEGFLSGGGLVIVHDEVLLGLLDGWLAGLDDDQFVDALPLLRRTFAEYAAPERRAIGERVRRARAGEPMSDVDDEAELDWDRVARTVPVLALLIGQGARP